VARVVVVRVIRRSSSSIIYRIVRLPIASLRSFTSDFSVQLRNVSTLSTRSNNMGSARMSHRTRHSQHAAVTRAMPSEYLKRTKGGGLRRGGSGCGVGACSATSGLGQAANEGGAQARAERELLTSHLLG
jgi:hypothetical protein